MEGATIKQALQTALDCLFTERVEGGYWRGRLSSSALATATAVSAIAGADEDDRGLIERGLQWLGTDQNDDGGWGDTPNSPSNLSTTVLAISAFSLTDNGTDAATMEAAEGYVSRTASASGRLSDAIRDKYGGDRTFAVPILANCALAGLVPWNEVPNLPFELAALPDGLWPIFRLQVVSYALPALIAVGMLVDKMKGTANPMVRGLRRMVRGTVLSKLAQIQPESGGFLEAVPLTAFVAMSMNSVTENRHSVTANCLRFLQSTVREDGSWPIDTNLSVWLTGGALRAVDEVRRAVGTELNANLQKTARKSRQWLAGQQQQHRHPFTKAAPGGWGWTHLSGSIPDADDTAGAVLALADHDYEQAVSAGVDWLLKLQNPDGGWPTFCRGWGHLPFDRSCPDITAHALRALHAGGGNSDGRLKTATAKGMSYLVEQQRECGSWLPLWFGNQKVEDGANPVLGTSRVLPALAMLEPEGRMAADGVQYLMDAQNADGGWGGARDVTSTVEETAVAILGLAGWPDRTHNAVSRGVEYLVDHIREGNWRQPAPIGLYFASLWYSEKLYPLIWTIGALARGLDLLHDDKP